MSDNPENDAEDNSAPRPTPLGLYDRQPTDGITSIEMIAIAVSGIWLVIAAIYFVMIAPSGGADSLRFLMTMLVIFMPVGMIWVAATAAKSSRVMREESRRLQSAIDAIRQAYLTQSQSRGLVAEPTITRKLDEIAAAARKTETALATFTSKRNDDSPSIASVTETQVATDDQPALELGTPAEDIAPPLSTDDFIRALNFPETAEDEEGFAALRRALKDRNASQLIQAAQDVLTLLSQEGIYMDDLRPDRARSEVWRHFASGARGKTIAGLGGIRDRSSLALTAGRMKQDPIFRDAAHHFLRKFDTTFSGFAEVADDADISALADTRTARAFMLLGRVAGTFD